MTKPEWGTKRTGPCGTKFYDFNKSPIICPGCGGEVITHEVKTNKNKNEVDKNLKSNIIFSWCRKISNIWNFRLYKIFIIINTR